MRANSTELRLSFAKLVERLEWRLRKRTRYLARGRLLRRFEVDDLVQEALLSAWRRFSAVKEHRRVSWMWLQAVATQSIVSVARRDQAKKRRGDGSREQTLEFEFVGKAEDPVLVAQQEEARERVRSAVTKLPPSEAIVVCAVYLEQQPVCQVARRLGIPVGTVYRRLFRARQRLKGYLQESE